MKSAPIPSNEAERLRVLREYEVLDTLPEAAYDDITLIAAQICNTPIALVSLVDADRQWFKSRVGLDALETPRDMAFCAHALLEPDNLFVVEDTKADVRFADNPLVAADPNIRFYAGAPLVTADGMPLGTLCVIDREPRVLDAEQSATLAALSRQVMAQLELRRALNELSETSEALERSNEGLARSNRDLEQFAYLAAHDLKEPLRMISSFTELLSESMAERLHEDEREYVKFISDGAARGQALTSDILQFSKLDQNDERTSLRLDELVAELGTRANQSYPLGHVVWDDAPMEIFANAGLIEHLLLNLITNGLKYNANERPTVSIALENVEQGIQITVTDNGIGIRQEALDKVFDMFFRGHGRGEYDGTGIGLAICRRVMELHGGAINVISSEDHGSTFTCLFPKETASGVKDGPHHHIAG